MPEIKHELFNGTKMTRPIEINIGKSRYLQNKIINLPKCLIQKTKFLSTVYFTMKTEQTQTLLKNGHAK